MGLGVAVGVFVGVGVAVGAGVAVGTGSGVGAGVADGTVGAGTAREGAAEGNGAVVGVEEATTPGATAVAAGAGDSLQLARTTARESSSGTRQSFNLTSIDSVASDVAGAPNNEAVAANNREYLDQGPPGDR
ncbi:MAG TPA: hypothetical protein QGG37_03350, partial [Chloroflexota bacterium]|nr:hypothetical protein [Chloroflexota bacterium]